MRYVFAPALMLAIFTVGCNDKNKQQAPAATPEPAPIVKDTPKDVLKPDDTLSSNRTYTPAPTVKPLPTASAAPAASGAKKYTVKKGDTLIKIAREQLGDEHKLKDLKAANPGIDYDKLKEGQEINLPATK